MSHTNTETTPASDLIGVIGLTTFGWKQVAVAKTKEEAERLAEQARDSNRYLKVKFN